MSTPPTTPETTEAPQAPAAPVPEPVVEAEQPQEAIEVTAEPQPSAWEHLKNAPPNLPARNAELLQAVEVLASQSRTQEATDTLGLIDSSQLDFTQRIDHGILTARLLQADGRHQVALRVLTGLERGNYPDAEQQKRIVRLKVYSHSWLNQPVALASELIRLYSLNQEDPEAQRALGHSLWSVLSRMSTEDLRTAFVREQESIGRQWIVLALALGLDSVRADPYQYKLALTNWQESNPEHPANLLIDSGLAVDSLTYTKIALLLPLTSVNGTSAQAFLDGFIAQHEANSDPQKPVVEVIDVGAKPTDVTRFYYQAIDQGADFVVGPLGVSFVSEMARFADFIVPTLLLGDTAAQPNPDYVYQFSLAPEQEGIGIARRARQDGHVSAMVIMSPQPWSVRAVAAFRDEWQRLGGKIIHVHEYELDKSDYSDTTKNILLIDASVARYQAIRTLMGESMKFVPRRRQDADFILLGADSEHGRLLKPYLDFLKAHDLPIYATSHIFSGNVNKIRDQDLSGIRFADMDWIIDGSEPMMRLRDTLMGERASAHHLDRLFAMGVDTYNIIARTQVLSEHPAARFHGITSTIRLSENGKVLRSPRWAVFNDGIPQLLSDAINPEQPSIPALLQGVVPAQLPERSE